MCYTIPNIYFKDIEHVQTEYENMTSIHMANISRKVEICIHISPEQTR